MSVDIDSIAGMLILMMILTQQMQCLLCDIFAGMKVELGVSHNNQQNQKQSHLYTRSGQRQNVNRLFFIVIKY